MRQKIALDVIISRAINDTDNRINKLTTIPEPCSYSFSSPKSHTQKMPCETYYAEKSDLSSLLENEKQALEKTNKQLQELKSQLQANK